MGFGMNTGIIVYQIMNQERGFAKKMDIHVFRFGLHVNNEKVLIRLLTCKNNVKV